jgi:putative transposase
MDQTQKEKLLELAKELKTPEQLENLTRELHKRFYESALAAELDEHLGYEPYAVEGRRSGNSRNGYTGKTLKTEHGDLNLEVPRDREGTFTPLIVPKGQRRLEQLDAKIRYLFATGLSTREISRLIEELYGIEVSAGLVSRITERVLEEIREWQGRPLEAVYAIVYLDCLMMKVRGEDGRVVNKAVYLAVGIDLEGYKELLGMWISGSEGARFWLSVLTELQNRGVKQMLIACVDGLTGFPEAIEAVYPQARVQLCVVHMVRNTLRFVGTKEQKKAAAGLRRIYQAVSEEAALLELGQFEADWESKYPQLCKSWRQNWERLNVIFRFPEEIRRVIYTTNAIESINSVVRKVVRKRKVFPTDEAALKTVYLIIEEASRRWTRPVMNWNAALNRLRIEFAEQLAGHL